MMEQQEQKVPGGGGEPLFLLCFQTLVHEQRARAHRCCPGQVLQQVAPVLPPAIQSSV